MPITIPVKVNPLVLSYPDFTLNSVINPDEFDQNNLDLRDKVNQLVVVEGVLVDNLSIMNTDINTAVTQSSAAVSTANASSALTNTIMGAGWTGQTLVQIKAAYEAGDASLQSQLSTDIANLVTHKGSADHDGRYYTEAEVTAIQGALQGQINTTAATLTTLQNQLNALDTTFSTDAERLAAIQNVITAFDLADDQLEALIVGKANTADVYTKAQIDAMTLGSYKFGFFKNQVTLIADETVVAVGIPEWNPADDPLLVYVGGLYQTEGIDYTINAVNKTILGSWLTGHVIDFFVVKNLRVVDVGDYVDGFLLTADSVQRTALAPAVRTELTTLGTEVDTLQSKAEFKTSTNSFTTGLTHVVTDAFITALTFVNVIPTGTKAGEWSVVASAGSFTITSDTAETNCAFGWNALKAGV